MTTFFTIVAGLVIAVYALAIAIRLVTTAGQHRRVTIRHGDWQVSMTGYTESEVKRIRAALDSHFGKETP